jgi:hypothetical protein
MLDLCHGSCTEEHFAAVCGDGFGAGRGYSDISLSTVGLLKRHENAQKDTGQLFLR